MVSFEKCVHVLVIVVNLLKMFELVKNPHKNNRHFN